jgi:hypothetical protein
MVSSILKAEAKVPEIMSFYKQVPNKYNEFDSICKEKIRDTLLLHSSFDYIINLKDCKHPLWKLIDIQFKIELKALRENLENLLEKDKIRPFNSLTGALNLVVPKLYRRGLLLSVSDGGRN